MGAVHSHACRSQWRPEGGAVSPGAEGTSLCELSDVNKPNSGLCHGSECSCLLGHPTDLLAILYLHLRPLATAYFRTRIVGAIIKPLVV